MSKPSKQEILERYDELGQELYDLRYTEEQKKKYAAILNELDEISLLLDNGCGTGLLFPYIEAQTVGLDLSSKLLAKALKRTKENQYLIQGDSEHLPFKDSTFDALVSITVIQNLPSPDLAVAESVRVTKHDSIIIISSLKRVYSEEEIIRLIEKDELFAIKIFTKENVNDWITVSTRK